MRHVISLLVENKPGVLGRVTGLISRRGFNIDSLSVAPTEDPTKSRITIVTDADQVAFEQITKQLNKLICVFKITDLTQEEAIERELVLFRVAVEPALRSEVIEISNVFRSKIVDVGKKSLTIEATGAQSKLKALEELLKPYGIAEITRTGITAITRSQK